MSFYEKLVLESNNLESLDSIKMDNEGDFLADLDKLNDADKFLDIIKSIEKNEEAILIFTDYDADGATSSAIMSKIFDKLNIKNKIVSSNKHLNEGYGINLKTLKRLEKDGVNPTNYPWILALDNGCTAFEAIEQANALGYKVMVIDHHECEDELPPAEVVIDAKRKDSKFPFKEMCTAGMVYYLGIHLMEFLDGDVDYAKSLVDIAALGTAADMVCISDRNYYIAKTGYAKMNNGSSLLDKFTILNEGEKLSQVVNQEVDNKFLTWTIAPMINAAVRVLGDAIPAIELLKNDSNTEQYAEVLVKVNEFRKLTSKLLAEQAQEVANPALLITDTQPLNYINQDIVVGFIDVNNIDDEEFMDIRNKLDITHNFSSGLNGIVASQLMNRLKKPTFIFGSTADESYLSASIRGFSNYNLKEGLLRAQDAGLIVHAGGHTQAAGATIAKEDLVKFIQFMNDDYINYQTEEVAEELTYDLYENIRNLKNDIDVIKEFHNEIPFGFSLVKPRFKIDMSKLRFEEDFTYKVSKTNDKKHLFYNMSGVKLIFWNISKDDRGEDLSMEEAIAKVKEMELDAEIEVNSYTAKNGKVYENLQIAITINE